MDLGSPHVFGELCVCPGGLHVVGGCCCIWQYLNVFRSLCAFRGLVRVEGSVSGDRGVFGAMGFWRAVWV